MAAESFALFGAPFDSGNRGVEALGRAAVQSIALARPGCSITVFDNGWGVREADMHSDLPAGTTVELCGVRKSRRVNRRESWANVMASARFGGLGNPVVERIKAADAVLDVSGGDSFSDIYGSGRLDTVMRPKVAALRLERPLALLPQTYGPFREQESSDRARGVLLQAATAWARDERSYQALVSLLGDAADPARHRSGVDLAFGLQPRKPDSLPDEVASILGSGEIVAGVNVSGLLADSPPETLGFDYVGAMTDVVAGLVGKGARVLLIPHVRDRSGKGESDIRGSLAVTGKLPHKLRSRVTIAPDTLDASEVKWLISRCDWFTGARMHATIAALSTGTAAAALAYSQKFQGVFDSAGVPDAVFDARSLSAPSIVDGLLDSFDHRDALRERLSQTIPAVVARSRTQVAEILDLATDSEPS